MPNTRDIRNRIKAVKNTAQITRAMQLVAASKMKRAQDKALEGRPYSELLARVLSTLADRVGDYQHAFMEARPVNTRGILLVSTDKGLCGSLNANLFRVIADLPDSAKFVSVGRKGTQFLSRSRRDLLADFSVTDKAQFGEVRPILGFMVKAFLDRNIDTIEVLYPRFRNTLVQEPQLVPLLPLTNLREAIARFIGEDAAETVPRDEEREMLYEPDPKQILDGLLDLFINKEIYQLILDAKASEHSSRMVAMKTATDNANALTDDLTLEYNKVRQAAITQEILEISAATLVSG